MIGKSAIVLEVVEGLGLVQVRDSFCLVRRGGREREHEEDDNRILVGAEWRRERV